MVMSLNKGLTRHAAAEAGEQLYDRRLRSSLEPELVGQFVAIHIPSEEYFVGPSVLEASRRLRREHPQAGIGDIYIRGISARAIIAAHTPRVSTP